MASVDASRPALEAVDNYGLDDLSDDPFRSPSPPADSKKRKEPDSGLGIDKEVSVQKRARVPNVKLDEAKLLGPNGIPNLRRRAAGLKIKGKGHEFSDASRLLSFYQLWLDDLFPKARFLDALAMVEKLGHKKQIITARNDWISEGRPGRKDEEENLESAPENPKTPARNGDDNNDDGVPDDEDIWGATPKASRAERPRDEPDDDDLAALMAEAESQDAPRGAHERPAAAAGPDDGPEDDDLDALMAEAAEQDAGGGSSNGKGASQARPTPHTDFADEEAAMQELEGLW
ncbi:hypothetical protein N3K66_000985 [Trichothecium roseum]|uniref:Uncharacterized protein n=1 Tax=Trichothecium roseum TaxID=47278 RepID=A0ACC0VDF4_9HYPO|nr:hypothetical protein N3K66_000985 [Trichothecium roseum]